MATALSISMLLILDGVRQLYLLAKLWPGPSAPPDNGRLNKNPQAHTAAWRSGNIVGRINEVTLRRARLVLGWVTVFGG